MSGAMVSQNLDANEFVLKLIWRLFNLLIYITCSAVPRIFLQDNDKKVIAAIYLLYWEKSKKENWA
jgi:hypothetical protein